MQNGTALAGRGLLAAIFLASGLGKIADFAGTQGYMEAYGMPLTGLLLVGAIVVELAGGLSVLAGWRARWGAAALAGFLVPTTLIFHSALHDQNQMIHFLKNVAIMGGLLTVVVHGAGAWSVDAWRARTAGAATGRGLAVA